MNLGRSLKIAMIQQDMLQKDLAKILGVSASTMANLANNRGVCKQDRLEKIATALNMSVSSFIALGE